MNFTKIEKKAINYLLVKLMKADGITDINEALTLYEISNLIKLSINESQESLKMDYEECKKVINSMEAYNKRVTREYFNHMAATDGNVAKSEQDMINDIFED